MSVFKALKLSYIDFLNRDKRGWRKLLFFLLYLLSLIYAGLVYLRNFLYELKILPIYTIDKKVISIGNISWGGTGKTSMVIYLHQYLENYFRVASITKGYLDEYKLLKDKLNDVFDSRDRVRLLKELSSRYDLFILDDGFQYRKLKRDLDIVILSYRENKISRALIPASIFREPLESIKRADIVIINHSGEEEKKEIEELKGILYKIKPSLKIYLANYTLRGFHNLNKDYVDKSYFLEEPFVVLTAIGYPQGFLQLLDKEGLKPKEVFIYPDHYHFSKKEILNLEKQFALKDIRNVIITYKDFYHFEVKDLTFNSFIADVEWRVYPEKEFFDYVLYSLKGY